MQEWLFPTLAFIAGPGEIAYWGELKQAFELKVYAADCSKSKYYFS